MRTIYGPDGPKRNPVHGPEPTVHKAKSPKWYSTEYLASVWAQRPARILAIAGFIAIAAILIMVFAAGTESTFFGGTDFSSAPKNGVTVGADGKVRLNVASILKPPVLGLIDETKIANSTYVGAVNMTVVPVNWSDLQPSSTNDAIPHSAAGQECVKPIVNAIDCRIKQVRAFNATNPTHPVAMKIRLFAGGNAPTWAKNIGGSPFSYTDPTDNKTIIIGRFWLPAYRAAYANLQAKLAAEYDSVPELRDVTISGCMTLYAEPFIRGLSDASTRAAFISAGYTEQADKDCHHDQIVAHQVWKQTRSSLSFNTFQTLDANGNFVNDEAFTESMMDLCRDATNGLGNRCVLENNSIRYPPLSGYTSMYSHMSALGGPITFQFAQSQRLDNTTTCKSATTTAQQIAVCDPNAWKNTLNWAIQQGATAVEVNGDYDNPIPAPSGTWPGYAPSILAGFDSQLEANPYQ